MRAYLILLLAACHGSGVASTATTGHVHGTTSDLAAVVRAVNEVDQLYREQAFLDLVKKRWWLSGTDVVRATSGDEIAGVLAGIRPAANEYVLGPIGCRAHLHLGWGGTFGVTTACTSIKLNDRILVRGNDQPTLINTIAHENTHMVGVGSGPRGCDRTTSKDSRFTDSNGGLVDANEVWLVSYAIGDLAQCYIQGGKDPERTENCLATILDGRSCNRRVVECCPGLRDPPGAADARAHTPHCAAIAPSCPAPRDVRC